MAALEEIFLEDNQLTGEIPDLSKLVKLERLFLGWNAFSGRFPASIWTLTELITIAAFDNFLTGSISPLVSGGDTTVNEFLMLLPV